MGIYLSSTTRTTNRRDFTLIISKTLGRGIKDIPKKGAVVGVKKFIKSVKKFLNLSEFETENKKESLKGLLKQLNNHKRTLKKQLELELEKKEKNQLKSDLEIVMAEIKKGKAILYKLYAKKTKGK
jgi:cell shape-determining protein MreC